MKIRNIILDYDGVFTKDDYTPVADALSKSSGFLHNEIEKRIGDIERKFVLKRDPKNRFLDEVKETFSFSGSKVDLRDLMNQRGDTCLYQHLYKFQEAGYGLSILSNQIGYRVPFVRKQLDYRFGIDNFDEVYFSPEIGLQKPFVGVTHDDPKSAMDVSGVNIFPKAVEDMRKHGYEPEACLFIDDSKKNIQSAQAAGFKGMVFTEAYQEDLNLFFEDLKTFYGVRV